MNAIESPDYPRASDVFPQPDRAADRIKLDWSLWLTESRFGRMALHLRCLVRDGKLRWHWAGIRRELGSRRTAPGHVSSTPEVAVLKK